MEKVLGFYHVCMVNDWYNIVKEQVSLIIKSGLYEKTEKIFVGCLGVRENKTILQRLLPEKFEIIFYNVNIQLYEVPTLSYLQSLSKREDFYCWYIHTKGATSAVIYSEKNITAWRHMMEYFIIENYEKCLLTLENPKCDACGVKVRCDSEYCYYGGNFWWSKSVYINKLPSILDKFEKSQSRFSAESMLGWSATPRFYAFEFYANYKNFYYNCANPKSYKKAKLPMPKFPVDNKQLTYLKERIKLA